MNILAIIGVLVAVVIGIFTVSSGGLFEDRGGGPIATGPGSREIRNPQPISRQSRVRPRVAPQPPTRTTPAPLPEPAPGVSAFRDAVRISTVRRSGTSPAEEYVILKHVDSRTDFEIDVTGWQIASLKSSALIPRAVRIPEIDVPEEDIVLPRGGVLTIVVGTPTYQRNFRENRCVGYLNQQHRFTPSLSSSCPDSRPDRGLLLARGFSGACIEFIERIPACRTPTIRFKDSSIGNECIAYINRNFTYAGCVANFRDRSDFLRNSWRVSLKRPTKLFDPRHDRVTLRDAQGLLVDEFEY